MTTSDSAAPVDSVRQHRAAAPGAVRCAILTISDTRTAETDTSGALIRRLLERDGHDVLEGTIVPDDGERIRTKIGEWGADPRIQAILCNGGTGIARRDTTFEALSGLLERRLDGFGELFRMLSYAEVGSAAMLSRAVAGLYRGTLVVAMPGSSNAVRLAMERLILPELGHLIFELTK